MRKTLLAHLLLAWPLAGDPARRLEHEVTVDAPRAQVWRAWTTREGARSFFSDDAKIELVPGGPYEIYFNMAEPPGKRGGETNQVVAFDPERMLLFTWNAPPKFGPLRDEHTFVVVRFDDAASGGTRVRLTQFGWREGAEWNAIYDYFDKAWPHVLASLKKSYDGKR
jgi:uncharacterized protein YndB with AHSA1/START domain